MKKKLSLFLINICLIISCLFMFVACDKTTTEDEEPFVYTATSLMYDGMKVLNFYSHDLEIIKIKDNGTLSPSDCLYDTGNEVCSKLITECYVFWLYCENGGMSYSDINGSITENYAIEYDGQSCNVVCTYTDSSRPPTSSAFRIVLKYNISFAEEHVSIVYEDVRKSFYNETKYYLDIISINDGIFIQYYETRNTYNYDIYKFFYNETSEQFYFVSNLIKEGSATKYLQDIQPTQFKDFVLPDFTYIVNKKSEN